MPPRAPVRSSARDRRHDLEHVADHRVVGARQDRRLGVGVDREDLLRALAAGHVLRRAADPARDVELGRDLRAGLARPGRCAAASRRSSPRASSRRRRRAARPAPRAARSPRPSRRRGRRDTTTGASASESPPVDVSTRSDHAHDEVLRRCSSGVNASTRPRSPGAASIATACGATVISFTSPCSRASSSRLPPQRMARHLGGIARRRARRSSPRARRRSSPRRGRAPRCRGRVPAATTAASERRRQLRDRARPGLRREAAVELGDVHRRARRARPAPAPRRGARADQHGLDGVAAGVAARERQRLLRRARRPRRPRARTNDAGTHHATPSLLRTARPRPARRPGPRRAPPPGCPRPGGTDQPHHLEPRLARAPASRRVDRLACARAASPAPTGSAAGSGPPCTVTTAGSGTS